MNNDTFLVRFWGTRGSFPVPGPATLRFGGNTTCVEVQAGPHTLIIDAGTGIINLGHEMLRRAREQGGAPIRATLLLTHMHHDHTQGFPYFPPAYIGTSVLYILGPRTFEEDLEETLNHAVLPPSFPVSLQELPSLKVVRSLQETETVLIDGPEGEPRIQNIYREQIVAGPDTLRVRIHKSYAHPRNGVYIYRIEWRGRSMVFASDTEGYVDVDRRLVHFARDTDLIIHDAQYAAADYAAKQGWGHSTPEMACAVAKAADARRLVLFHHEPRYDDARIAELEREAQAIFPETQAAFEGLEIVL
ncbi:MBL fold metallo-hydrolase [Oscillochloris sp. ZM17-4]|uniref:MBL fold metallo-hydrolase n=1 Tax=Oscillochloris sp. ZM17-4 TaxID=2866714 RepID=UPI001C7372C1|nr:MBL fold metallo-hydrolase [Oscillochloris sp. ZM17-4]MBX0326191.1 MBL fold metallo-hydrolase [Oscillochloris sp. ZM17-4]